MSCGWERHACVVLARTGIAISPTVDEEGERMGVFGPRDGAEQMVGRIDDAACSVCGYVGGVFMFRRRELSLYWAVQACMSYLRVLHS